MFQMENRQIKKENQLIKVLQDYSFEAFELSRKNYYSLGNINIATK